LTQALAATPTTPKLASEMVRRTRNADSDYWSRCACGSRSTCSSAVGGAATDERYTLAILTSATCRTEVGCISSVDAVKNDVGVDVGEIQDVGVQADIGSDTNDTCS
jgi:hypothetical protein